MSQASMHCKTPGNFHCVKDEYGRIGWVCAQPIWVEKDRCPVYNIGAEKLDTTGCPQTKCPPYNYRSNDIDVEYACRYLYVRPTTSPSTFSNVSTETSTTTTTTTSSSSPELLIILTALLSLVVVVGVIAAIVVLCLRRRKNPLNDDMGLEEFGDLLKESDDTSNKAEEQSESFKQARKHLDQKKMVAITGAQGSGKTFLARELVADLKKNETKIKIIWISNIIELIRNQTTSLEEFDIFVFDGIFYELQVDEKLAVTIKASKEYLKRTKHPYLIFTIPSYIWQKHSRCTEFETWLGEVRVDLDKRSGSEKQNILKFLMNRYDVPRGLALRICKLENTLLKEASKSVGFPALISWMCNQASEDEVENILTSPLQSMSKAVYSLKKEDSGKYLILAYMSLKDGKMDVTNLDKAMFDSLKNKYDSAFMDKKLDEYARSMVGYYMLRNEDGNYEFDLNIMKKIVLVSVAKENALFVQMYCDNEYQKYITTTESCPKDIDPIYAECFLRKSI